MISYPLDHLPKHPHRDRVGDVPGATEADQRAASGSCACGDSALEAVQDQLKAELELVRVVVAGLQDTRRMASGASAWPGLAHREGGLGASRRSSPSAPVLKAWC